MEFLIVLVILLAVVLVVTGPLRRPAKLEREAGGWQSEGSRLIDLEAAREAKYREIRDAELDHRTGKLSDADYAAVDAGLRAEAAEILHTLDRARASDQVDS